MRKERAIELASMFYGKEVQMTVLESMLLKTLWQKCGLEKSLPEVANSIKGKTARYPQKELFEFLESHQEFIISQSD